MTMSPQDVRITFDEGNGTTHVVNNVVVATHGGAMYEEFTVNTPCGDINLVASNNNSIFYTQSPTVNQGATQYNQVVLTNANSVQPVFLSGDVSYQCSYTTLTATYTNPSLVTTTT